MEVGKEADEDLQKRDGARADRDLRLEAGLVEEALEGTEHRPARQVAEGGRLGAEGQGAVLMTRGHQRRDRLGSIEPDDRVVSPVDESHDGVGRAEVDAKLHVRSIRSGPLPPREEGRPARVSSRRLMTFDRALGLLVSIVGIATGGAYLPQAVRIWKRRSSGDVSILTYVLFLGGQSVYFVYGIRISQWPLIVGMRNVLLNI